jgi:purine-binding chemotaxis protein CheW
MTEPSQVSLRELISFRIGPQEYCVDIMQVREIRGWTPTTPLPAAATYICGVINLRGAVLPVVDMAARLGLPASQPTERHVIVVVWIGGQLVGLLVDAVCDILAVAPDDMQPTPELAAGDVQTFVEALINVDMRMIGLIALNNILPPIHQTQAA